MMLNGNDTGQQIGRVKMTKTNANAINNIAISRAVGFVASLDIVDLKSDGATMNARIKDHAMALANRNINGSSVYATNKLRVAFADQFTRSAWQGYMNRRGAECPELIKAEADEFKAKWMHRKLQGMIDDVADIKTAVDIVERILKGER